MCLNVMFLCLWGVARGSEVLSGGVTQSRDDWSSSSSQGEWSVQGLEKQKVRAVSIVHQIIH